MRKRTLTLNLVAVAGLAAMAVLPATTSGAEAPDAAPSSQVARGKYLVSIMGCHDCHTPWKLGPKGAEPDMSRALSGHPEDLAMPPAPDLGKGPWVWAGAGTNTAFAGPWGVSFTANLTPDAETGLGKWTSKTFLQTLRTGKHEGVGRPILPPMPWPVYRQATDDDLQAIFAYLQSLPPIHNKVPQPIDPAEGH